MIRVVLVDDVPAVRGLLRTAMRVRGGFSVVGEAADGMGAVAAVMSQQPDVVVLDLGLPDLAGREVLTRLRRAAPATRIVVFSGTEVADREWIEQRVAAFVRKDRDVEYLIDLLHTLGQRPERSTEVRLPREEISVARARRFVRDALGGWGMSKIVDDALLVVSELVTNAVIHARSSCLLRLTADRRSVRVEVLDDGQGMPEPQQASMTREHGRGLQLVSLVTSAWGITVIPGDGKCVWAEFPLVA